MELGSTPTPSSAPPMVEIGLVVRNGADHIAEAIESWRAQTRDDWRLVIYDNASTDDTPAIARRYGAYDPRIRLDRHERDIGMTGNFRFALARAQAPLFCWSAADDLRDPRFLERLLDHLEHDQDLLLAGCTAGRISPDGEPLGVVERNLNRIDGLVDSHGATRLAALLREPAWELIFSVMRTGEARSALLPVLDRLNRDDGRPQYGGDVIVMAALAAAGRIHVERAPLLLLRDGGHSHQRDAHHGLLDLARDLLRYRLVLKRTIHRSPARAPGVVITSHWLRAVTSAPMRRRLADHMPPPPRPVQALIDWRVARRDPALRRLRSRLRAESDAAGGRVRIVLCGGGRHTARRLGSIIRALRIRGEIIAIVDDNPKCAASGNRWGVPCFPPDDLARLGPMLLLASSDAYEAALLRFAQRIAPPGCAVWAIYDIALERCDETPTRAGSPAIHALDAVRTESSDPHIEWERIDGAA